MRRCLQQREFPDCASDHAFAVMLYVIHRFAVCAVPGNPAAWPDLDKVAHRVPSAVCACLNFSTIVYDQASSKLQDCANLSAEIIEA